MVRAAHPVAFRRQSRCPWFIVAFLVALGLAALGCWPFGAGTYCQSGPKYGTQCYSTGGYSEAPALPPPRGGVHECVATGDSCSSGADCCETLAECNGGFCIVPKF